MTHEYLSDFQKGQIIALWKVHGIYQKVADELHLPYNTVRSFIQRYHTRRSIENLPRSGAPRKLSQRTTSRLRRTSRKSRRTTLAKLRDDIAPYVSTRTVSRALAVGGIKKHPLAPRPQLTPIDARRRLAWAREHANWKDEDWQGVIWSDECSVEKSKDPRSHWGVPKCGREIPSRLRQGHEIRARC
ncbi:hypothetical protein BOTBODRAFT_484406 [Botryobasidium botryosum FD-172 SS1]|uniref:Transposase Tc1-like domain-containing protein n=1 Tax=Botryobasidium botryosum (strain FD-172 SS1) TaxID=930990 RepID=A0A067N4Q5_BOTB1|nr:hypothetical protein BOTBODRAFT_484406 [Botryobasidium botryosum FD-172 SS1]